MMEEAAKKEPKLTDLVAVLRENPMLGAQDLIFSDVPGLDPNFLVDVAGDYDFEGIEIRLRPKATVSKHVHKNCVTCEKSLSAEDWVCGVGGHCRKCENQTIRENREKSDRKRKEKDEADVKRKARDDAEVLKLERRRAEGEAQKRAAKKRERLAKEAQANSVKMQLRARARAAEEAKQEKAKAKNARKEREKAEKIEQALIDEQDEAKRLQKEALQFWNEQQLKERENEPPEALVPIEAQSQKTPDCVVCLVQPKFVALIPCGHICACSDCAPKLKKCPLCRSLITGTLKTYF